MSEEKFKNHFALEHVLPSSVGNVLLEARGEYLGGHAVHPNKCDVSLSVCENEVYVKPLKMRIPYSAIKEVRNVDKRDVSALRVVALGVVGALWKKKERYLCLIYDDEVQEENPLFKFDNSAQVQSLIYQQVVKVRKQKGIEVGTSTFVRKTEQASETFSSQASVTKYCKYCGSKNDSDAVFCVNCGKETGKKQL